MANRFEPLQAEDEEEIEEEVASIDYEPEEDSVLTKDSEHGQEDDEDEAGAHLDDSRITSTSGKSYYAEYLERKAQMRGGAGGSNASRNKQLTNALDALADVIKILEAMQHEEGSPEDVISKIAKLVTQWQEKTPTRQEMRDQLLKMHVLLEKDRRQQVDPKESHEHKSGQAQQSFYGDFVKRLREEKEENNTNKWTAKGKTKGKGKGKTDGKNSDAKLPKFDVKRIFPTKALTTWQILSKELKAGKEPTGAAVVLESSEKMAEFQSLAKAHGIKRSVTMIAKASDEKNPNIVNPSEAWLPYIGNLALAKAIIATTNGEKTTLQGMEPIKKESKMVSK